LNYSWNAGNRYEGGYIADVRHSACTFKFFNGETLNCTWEDGRCPEITAHQAALLAAFNGCCSVLDSLGFGPLAPVLRKLGTTDDAARLLDEDHLTKLGLPLDKAAGFVAAFKSGVAGSLSARKSPAMVALSASQAKVAAEAKASEPPPDFLCPISTDVMDGKSAAYERSAPLPQCFTFFPRSRFQKSAEMVRSLHRNAGTRRASHVCKRRATPQHRQVLEKHWRTIH
jgi:hypothetical protein